MNESSTGKEGSGRSNISRFADHECHIKVAPSSWLRAFDFPFAFTLFCSSQFVSFSSSPPNERKKKNSSTEKLHEWKSFEWCHIRHLIHNVDHKSPNVFIACASAIRALHKGEKRKSVVYGIAERWYHNVCRECSCMRRSGLSASLSRRQYLHVPEVNPGGAM